MILIPEIETVVILVPRTGSKSLRKAIAATHPNAMQIYRHMEADGVPQGYDRWRRVGVVREPVERLWSLYKFIGVMAGQRDGLGKWEPAYVSHQRESVQRPFSEWIVHNQTVFTGPYDSAGQRFFPGFTVRHSMPETRKSQFIYLRPDLGTKVFQFGDLHQLADELGLVLPHEHRGSAQGAPALSDAAADHVRRFFAWDLEMVAAHSDTPTPSSIRDRDEGLEAERVHGEAE